MASLLDPPFFSQQSQSNKRKRPKTTDEEFPSSLPTGSINPLSHSPGVVAQFAIAGLSETDEDPSQRIRDFPHRGLAENGASAVEVESDEDPETEGDEAARPKSKKNTSRKRGGHFDVLLQSTHHFIDQGEIEKAARTYGLLLQLRPSGLPVDVRHHDIWAIGAEILMREGEGSAREREDNENTSTLTKRWGRAANMSKVRAYFDTLIQQHPYDYKTPNIVSAFDFWIAMFSCEIYNTHAEHTLALERLSSGEEDHRRESFGHDDSFGSDDTDSSEARLVQKKEELRLQALSSMQDITKRMDVLIQDMPYSRNQQYIRLRAMASLYIADLVVPVSPVSMLQTQQGQQARLMEQDRARKSLMRIVTYGGELDNAALRVLNPSDDSEGDTSLSLYASLPIREL
uniref:Transcription factor domain-containing protein n=1 Tax=Gibberella zeae TaxID=5518 RepID=A0A4E9ELC7_GIBZA